LFGSARIPQAVNKGGDFFGEMVLFKINVDIITDYWFIFEWGCNLGVETNG
jgi:hypothetical protein